MKRILLPTRLACIVVLTSQLAIQTHCGAGTVVAWGDDSHSQTNVPPDLTNAVAVAGGTFHSLALDDTGAVVGWGDNSVGETTSPSALTNAAAIAAGDGFSLALQSNNTIVTWGNAPASPAGLTNVAAIAVSLDNILALTSDGNVTSWGSGAALPVPANVTNVVAIAAGNTHSLALEGDGTVAAWGGDSLGETEVPTGLTDVVALAAGAFHSLALRRNGKVVAWGDNTWGQSAVPSDLSNVVAIAAGAYDSLALKSDGSLEAWGDNTYGQTNVPSLLNVVGIAAGRYHNLAVVGDGSPVITVQPVCQYNASNETAIFCVMAAGSPPLSYQWLENGTNIAGATNFVLTLANLPTADAAIYSVVVSNLIGSVESEDVVLPPAWRRPLFLTQPPDQNVLCGDTTTLQPSISGTEPLSYQWFFNDAAIPEATNSTLALDNITADQAGEYSLIVSNAYGSATSRVAALTVTAEVPLITSALTAAGIQGNPFSYTITGQHQPISYSASGLPAGLDVNTTNGLIQGTPLESGTYNVQIGAVNLCASAYTNLTLTITSSAPVITSPLNASGAEQAAFSYQITATESPASFGADNLPQGLNVDPATGIISGSPLYAGVFDTTILASNVWGVGKANLQLTFSNAPITGLSIANVTTNYSSPYLLDFKFSLRDNDDPTMGDAVVTDPSLLSATAFENSNTVSPSETSVLISRASAKELKAYLVLDFSESIASITENGDTNNNGVSDAVDTEVSAAQNFVNQQPADAQIGVYEFHRDDEAPNLVQSLTTDKTLLDDSIAGIWTNYVQDFPAGTRCWDALGAAINNLGKTTNNDEAHYVIFVSDGQDTSSTNYSFQNVLTTATNDGVQVYCVGFGKEIDTNALETITSQTEGRFYEATNISDLASEFAQIGKDLSGQYILRWATLQRSSQAFMPSFQITYQGITADSPTNPVYISGTNDVVDTNATPPTTNYVPIYATNFIISPYTPSAYAGDVTVGSLRMAPNADVHPSGITLRATYVPRYVRQIQLHYRANWPCTVSLESTNPGEMLYGWSLTQTNDGMGGQWLLISSPDPEDPATSIPFADFGPLLTFSFQDVADASNSFSVFNVDNSIYTNTGNQSFVLEDTNFITVYPLLPHGTPVPWLIQYGFTNPNNWVADETNLAGNGMLVWQDYVAGLNPNNASSKFVIQNIVLADSLGHSEITFSTALNRTYRLEASSDLQTWQTLQDGIPGTGGDVTVTDSRIASGLTQTFYRIVVY